MTVVKTDDLLRSVLTQTSLSNTTQFIIYSCKTFLISSLIIPLCFILKASYWSQCFIDILSHIVSYSYNGPAVISSPNHVGWISVFLFYFPIVSCCPYSLIVLTFELATALCLDEEEVDNYEIIAHWRMYFKIAQTHQNFLYPQPKTFKIEWALQTRSIILPLFFYIL